MKVYLNEIMEAKDITYVMLSEKTGIGKAQINRYMTGTTTPSLADATKISKALEITLDELVYGIKEEEPVSDNLLENDEVAATVNRVQEVDDVEENNTVTPEEILDSMDPSALLSKALQENDGMYIISSTSSFDIERLCKYFDKVFVKYRVFAKKREFDGDYMYYIVFNCSLLFEIKDINKITKKKLFEKDFVSNNRIKNVDMLD